MTNRFRLLHLADANICLLHDILYIPRRHDTGHGSRQMATKRDENGTYVFFVGHCPAPKEWARLGRSDEHDPTMVKATAPPPRCLVGATGARCASPVATGFFSMGSGYCYDSTAPAILSAKFYPLPLLKERSNSVAGFELQVLRRAEDLAAEFISLSWQRLALQA